MICFCKYFGPIIFAFIKYGYFEKGYSISCNKVTILVYSPLRQMTLCIFVIYYIL